MHHSQIHVDRLHELLEYKPETGAISLKASGKVLDSKNCKGYVRFTIDGAPCLGHRVAWAMMTGAWPDVFLDHKNRIRHDNRWDNLRPATHSLNMANRLDAVPASGYRGVYWAPHVNRWRAELVLKVNGKRRKKILGYFDDPAEAGELRELAGRMVWGDYYVEHPVNAGAKIIGAVIGA